MALTFSRARLSVHNFIDGLTRSLVQMLWWGIVLAIGISVVGFFNGSAYAAGRHHRNAQATAQANYTFDGDRYVWLDHGERLHPRSHAEARRIRHLSTGVSERRVRRAAAKVVQPLQNRTLTAYAEQPARAPNHAEAATRGLVTLDTAAGIKITVSSDMAPKIVPFIAANIAQGKKFHSIRCWNYASTHVKGSTHFSGNGCDFKPHADGQLAYQFGLRNGCDFSRIDCMHIDNGLALGFPPGSRYRGSRVAFSPVHHRRHRTRVANR